MSKTLPFSMRFDPDLKAELQALADADNRSLTNYVNTVLRTHVRDATRQRDSGGAGVAKPNVLVG